MGGVGQSTFNIYEESTLKASNLSKAEQEWLRAVFSSGSRTVQIALREFFAGIVLSCNGDPGVKIMSRDPDVVRSSRLPNSGAAYFNVLAVAIAEERELERSAAAAGQTAGQKAGQFKFGNQQDFVAGVQVRGLSIRCCILDH